MNIAHIYYAAIALGHQEPISIEPDGSIWTGNETERYDLTKKENAAVHAEAAQSVKQHIAQKKALLEKLGITADEAALLLG